MTWQSITQGQHTNRMNSRQWQWQRWPGMSTDVPCCPESVVCTDQIDYVVYIVPWPSCPHCGFPTPKTLYKPLSPPLKYPYPWKGYGFASGKGKGRCENTCGLPVPITICRNDQNPAGMCRASLRPQWSGRWNWRDVMYWCCCIA